jgi:hypothetical protein
MNPEITVCSVWPSVSIEIIRKRPNEIRELSESWSMWLC